MTTNKKISYSNFTENEKNLLLISNDMKLVKIKTPNLEIQPGSMNSLNNYFLL